MFSGVITSLMTLFFQRAPHIYDIRGRMKATQDSVETLFW